MGEGERGRDTSRDTSVGVIAEGAVVSGVWEEGGRVCTERESHVWKKDPFQ